MTHQPSEAFPQGLVAVADRKSGPGGVLLLKKRESGHWSCWMQKRHDKRGLRCAVVSPSKSQVRTRNQGSTAQCCPGVSLPGPIFWMPPPNWPCGWSNWGAGPRIFLSPWACFLLRRPSPWEQVFNIAAHDAVLSALIISHRQTKQQARSKTNRIRDTK